MHDSESTGGFAIDRNGGNCEIGTDFDVFMDEFSEVDAVELIPTEDEGVLEFIIFEMEAVFSDSIRSSLVPGRIRGCLFSCENLDKASGKGIELVGLGDMPMQGGGVKLSEQVNFFKTTVDAIGDGNIDETVFACERHGRLGSFFG